MAAATRPSKAKQLAQQRPRRTCASASPSSRPASARRGSGRRLRGWVHNRQAGSGELLPPGALQGAVAGCRPPERVSARIAPAWQHRRSTGGSRGRTTAPASPTAATVAPPTPAPARRRAVGGILGRRRESGVAARHAMLTAGGTGAEVHPTRSMRTRGVARVAGRPRRVRRGGRQSRGEAAARCGCVRARLVDARKLGPRRPAGCAPRRMPGRCAPAPRRAPRPTDHGRRRTPRARARQPRSAPGRGANYRRSRGLAAPTPHQQAPWPRAHS